MNITVYLGSSSGNDSVFEDAAREMAHVIVRGGHTMVYGGCSTGMMGIAARGVLAGGGRVVGIMPRFLTRREPAQQGLTELHMVDTMTERKEKMIELGDAFVALPGGPGTLEEISEVVSDMKLFDVGVRPDVAPGGCVFYSRNGFYAPLQAQLRIMCAQGFTSESLLARIRFPQTPRELAACF
jgi:uncharacterized protein (TIGR00730 family)